jgi:CRP-like cAMP-binding protein
MRLQTQSLRADGANRSHRGKKATDVQVGKAKATGGSVEAIPHPWSAPLLPPLASEVASLLDLNSVGRTVRPGRQIVAKGRRCNAVFLITEGIAIRYRILRDGRRLILNVLLPGDFAEVTGWRFDTALLSIKTVTQVTFSPIPLPKLVGLIDAHPRLAAKLLWSFSGETAIRDERLIAVIRRHSATKRLAHLLLELLTRLQVIGLADECSYNLPLTREMISDMLGLNVRSVNRALLQLRAAGFVRIKDRVVLIQNIDELIALADFDQMVLMPPPIYEDIATDLESGTISTPS